MHASRIAKILWHTNHMRFFQLKKQLHISQLIGVIAGAIIVGVVAAQWWFDFGYLAWLLVGIGLLAIGLWRRAVYVIPLLIIGGMFLGLWRGSVLQSELVVYEQLYGQVVAINGKVSEDADIGKQGELVLRLDDLRIGEQTLPGKIWVTAQTKFDIKRGDRVIFDGNLSNGFGNFAGVVYQASIKQVQRPQPGDVARQVRDWFADSVRTAISEPQASLGIGYLVGQRRALPPELADALVIAGLTHVVVASGYNLTILIRFARRLFVRISKYLATLVSGTLILGFIMVTGMSPSMSRAGLVAGLALVAWYYGRKFHPLILLPFAAAVTLLVNPSYAWGDLGWQLSFAAFAGVMIVAPLLQAYFFGNKKLGTARQIFGETISAYIVTLPILLLAFGIFSNVAIIANILILPLVPLAMLLTFIAGIGALVLPGAAAIIGQPAEWLLGYMTTTAQYFAGLPWAQGEIEIGWWHMAVAYLFIIAACVYMQRATKFNLRSTNLVE